MQTEVIYKTLRVITDTDIRSAEFIINDYNLESPDAYIKFISLVSEYIEAHFPEYVIFNKKDSDFELDKLTIPFTRDIIFKQLRFFGVRKVLMVVSENQFEKTYKDIEARIPLMKGFLNLEEAYQWIRKDATNPKK